MDWLHVYESSPPVAGAHLPETALSLSALNLRGPFCGLVYPTFSDKRNKSPEKKELAQGHLESDC